VNDSTYSARKAAFDHGWEWFKYHADQRLTLMRYYLILIGVVATAFYTTFEKDLPYAAAGAALFGMVSSVCFGALDKRVSDLIKLGEKLLAKEQEKLSSELAYAEIKIVERAEQNQVRALGSYSRAFRLLIAFTIIMFAAGALVAVASARGMFGPTSPDTAVCQGSGSKTSTAPSPQ